MREEGVSMSQERELSRAISPGIHQQARDGDSTDDRPLMSPEQLSMRSDGHTRS